MSKKSQKSSSQQQQQQQHQQQKQAQPSQPKNQLETGSRHKRQASSQSKGSADAVRDSCDLSSAKPEAGQVVAPETDQKRASENSREPVGQSRQPATPKGERNKRPKLQPAGGGAENKPAPAQDRMADSHSAGLAQSQNQAVAHVNQGEQNICAACAKPIRERYLLMALDKRWHEDCLKCACCDCRLGEVGSSLFTHSDKLLCRRDFLRIFGKKGLCAACNRQIPAYELVMRAQEKAYHMDCFACQRCQYRFCVGDQFHMTQAHKIICLLCHREQLERCRQQAQEQEVVAGLLSSQLAGAFDGPTLELPTDCEKQDQLDVNKQEDDEEPLELAQLENVAREPHEQVDQTLVACQVRQMRLPSQKDQERACVM